MIIYFASICFTDAQLLIFFNLWKYILYHNNQNTLNQQKKKKSLIAVQFHAYIMNSLKKYKHIGFSPSFTLPTQV